MLRSLLNIYVLSGCQVLTLVFFRCSPSSSQNGPPEPDICTNERGGSTGCHSLSSLAAHFSQLELVAGLWGKVFAGSRVRGKVAVQNLMLSLCSGKTMIMHVKCGLEEPCVGGLVLTLSAPFLSLPAHVC